MGEILGFFVRLLIACMVAVLVLLFYVVAIPICLLWPRSDPTVGYWRTVATRLRACAPTSDFFSGL